jgi:large subunit ribosomal protein L46
MRASVLLSRQPQITRDLSPFEKAFLFYQRRLNERLALPFTRYFYFKKGTAADLDWKRKAKHRFTPARELGVYHSYGKYGWNDELLVGAEEVEPQNQVEALLRDSESDTKNQNVREIEDDSEGRSIFKPPPRVTHADATTNERSMDRLLQRSLYLVVKDQSGAWRFPTDTLVGQETLHEVGFIPIPCIMQSTGLTITTGGCSRATAYWRIHYEHLGNRKCTNWVLSG